MAHFSDSKVVSLSEKQQMLIDRCTDQGLLLLDLKGIETLIADLEIALLDSGGGNAGVGETPGDIIALTLRHTKRRWRQLLQEKKNASTGNGKMHLHGKARKEAASNRPAEAQITPAGAKVSDASAQGRGRPRKNVAITDTLPLVGMSGKEHPAKKARSGLNSNSADGQPDEGAGTPVDAAKQTTKNTNQKTGARAAERAALKAAKKAAREAERAARKAARIAEREVAKAARKAEKRAERKASKPQDTKAARQGKKPKPDKKGDLPY